LRLNVWYFCKGINKSNIPTKFPYKAISPYNNKYHIYKNINDIETELVDLYNDAKINGYKVGRAIFEQHLFFCNPLLLYKSKYQVLIKAIEFSKQTQTPMYKNMENTPAKYIDQFFIINKEISEALNGNK